MLRTHIHFQIRQLQIVIGIKTQSNSIIISVKLYLFYFMFSSVSVSVSVFDCYCIFLFCFCFRLTWQLWYYWAIMRSIFMRLSVRYADPDCLFIWLWLLMVVVEVLLLFQYIIIFVALVQSQWFFFSFFPHFMNMYKNLTSLHYPTSYLIPRSIDLSFTNTHICSFYSYFRI